MQASSVMEVRALLAAGGKAATEEYVSTTRASLEGAVHTLRNKFSLCHPLVTLIVRVCMALCCLRRAV
ncbi:hypothetical protein EON66_11105 [archaeon]|nr:MAG: hypothetical protein EON66_11105 [archaeon]